MASPGFSDEDRLALKRELCKERKKDVIKDEE